MEQRKLEPYFWATLGVLASILSCFLFFTLGHASVDSNPNYFGAYLPLLIAFSCIGRLLYLATLSDVNDRFLLRSTIPIKTSLRRTIRDVVTEFRLATVEGSSVSPYDAYLGLLAIKLNEGCPLSLEIVEAVKGDVAKLQYGDVSDTEIREANTYLRELIHGDIFVFR